MVAFGKPFSQLCQVFIWRISVELIVSYLAELTCLLQNVFYTIAKNSEQFFSDFKIISSAAAKIACHKVMLSGKLFNTFLHL